MREIMTTQLLALVAVLVSGMLLAGCGAETPNYPQRQPPPGFLAKAENRAAGKSLFLRKCASCHGTPHEGAADRADFFRPPAPDFTAPRYAGADPAYLYYRIESGKNAEPYRSRGSVMPAWGPHLSDEQIWQLVAYLRQRPRSI